MPQRLTHHVLFPQRLPRPVLALQDHRATIEALGVVPLVLGDGEAQEVAVVIVEPP